MPNEWDGLGTVVFAPERDDVAADTDNQWDNLGKVIVPAIGDEVDPVEDLLPPNVRRLSPQYPDVEQSYLEMLESDPKGAEQLAKAQDAASAQDYISRWNWSRKLQDPDTQSQYIGWATDEQLQQIPEEIRKQVEEYRKDPKERALFALDHAIKYRSGFERRTYAETFADILKPVPFFGGIADIARSVEVKNAAERVEDGTWKPRDIDMVAGYLRDMQRAEKELKGSPVLGRAKEILKEMPAFMGEFVTTGGLFTAGSKAVRKGTQKLLSRAARRATARAAIRAGSRVPGVAGGLAAQLAANPQLIGRGTADQALQRQLGNIGAEEGAKKDASLLGNLPAGLVSAAGELLTERSGGVMGKAVSNLPLGVGSLTRAYQKSKAGQAMAKAGVHGPLEEMSEERLNEILQGGAATAFPEYIDADFGATGGLIEGGEARKEAAQQLAAEGVAFAALPAAATAAGMTAGGAKLLGNIARRRRWGKGEASRGDWAEATGEPRNLAPKDAKERFKVVQDHMGLARDQRDQRDLLNDIAAIENGEYRPAPEAMNPQDPEYQGYEFTFRTEAGWAAPGRLYVRKRSAPSFAGLKDVNWSSANEDYQSYIGTKDDGKFEVVFQDRESEVVVPHGGPSSFATEEAAQQYVDSQFEQLAQPSEPTVEEPAAAAETPPAAAAEPVEPAAEEPTAFTEDIERQLEKLAGDVEDGQADPKEIDAAEKAGLISPGLAQIWRKRNGKGKRKGSAPAAAAAPTVEDESRYKLVGEGETAKSREIPPSLLKRSQDEDGGPASEMTDADVVKWLERVVAGTSNANAVDILRNFGVQVDAEEKVETFPNGNKFRSVSSYRINDEQDFDALRKVIGEAQNENANTYLQLLRTTQHGDKVKDERPTWAKEVLKQVARGEDAAPDLIEAIRANRPELLEEKELDKWRKRDAKKQAQNDEQDLYARTTLQDINLDNRILNDKTLPDGTIDPGLKTIAKNAGVTRTGKKEDLIKRLKERQAQAAPAPTDEPAAAAPTVEGARDVVDEIRETQKGVRREPAVPPSPAPDADTEYDVTTGGRDKSGKVFESTMRAKRDGNFYVATEGVGRIHVDSDDILDVTEVVPEPAADEGPGIEPANVRSFFSDNAWDNVEAETEGNSRTILVYMSPEDFLTVAERVPEEASKGKRRGISETLEAGKQFEDIPYLNFNNDGEGNAKVTGHEGRHRAMALRGLDIERMPVRLRSVGGEEIRWNTFTGRMPERLIKQDGEKEETDSIPFPAIDEEPEDTTGSELDDMSPEALKRMYAFEMSVDDSYKENLYKRAKKENAAIQRTDLEQLYDKKLAHLAKLGDRNPKYETIDPSQMTAAFLNGVKDAGKKRKGKTATGNVPEQQQRDPEPEFDEPQPQEEEFDPVESDITEDEQREAYEGLSKEELDKQKRAVLKQSRELIAKEVQDEKYGSEEEHPLQGVVKKLSTARSPGTVIENMLRLGEALGKFRRDVPTRPQGIWAHQTWTSKTNPDDTVKVRQVSDDGKNVHLEKGKVIDPVELVRDYTLNRADDFRVKAEGPFKSDEERFEAEMIAVFGKKAGTEGMKIARQQYESRPDDKKADYWSRARAEFGFSDEAPQDALFQPGVRPEWFSKLLQTLDRKKFKAISHSDLRNMLHGEGVKEEEIEWANLELLFEGRRTVPKDELRSWIAANALVLDETVLGEDPGYYEEAVREQAASDIRDVLGPNVTDEVETALSKWVQTDDADAWHTIDAELADAGEPNMYAMIRRAEKERLAKGMPSPPRFSSYTIDRENVQNYREILVKLPDRTPEVDFPSFEEWLREEILPDHQNDPENRRVYEADRREASNKAQRRRTFKHSHWPGHDNVIVHLRVQDRVIDGKRVLLVEEIQSDWHQDALQLGYEGETRQRLNQLFDERRQVDRELDKNREEFIDLKERVDYVRDKMKDVDHTDAKDVSRPENVQLAKKYSTLLKELEANRNMHETLWTRRDKVQNQMAELRGKGEGVPDAPFKKSWRELGMKRAFQEAVNGGYDEIMVVGGVAQAERSGLREVVDKLAWAESTPEDKERHHLAAVDLKISAEGFQIKLIMDKDGTIISAVNHDGWVGKTLDEVVGKDIAKRVMSEESGELTEEGLAVGGEGKIHTYDKVLPSFIKKYLKRFGVKPDRAVIDGRRLPSDEWEYAGPDRSLGQIRNVLRPFDNEQAEDVPNELTFEETATSFRVGIPIFSYSRNIKALRLVATEMEKGTSFGDAMAQLMQKSASTVLQTGGLHTAAYDDLALLFGGEMRLAEKAKQITVHRVPITDKMRSALSTEGQPLFQTPRQRAERRVQANLTPEEAWRTRDRGTSQRLVDMFVALPPDSELEEAAMAGITKRGWYRRAAEYIEDLFGPDATRFAAALSALSPRQPVINNLKMTLEVWEAWNSAGRPKKKRAIKKALRGVADGWQFGSREPNLMRALMHPEGEFVPLSGFKVDSFTRNLLGDLEAVTNDVWMARFAGFEQTELKNPKGYFALNAKVRAVAKQMNMKPAEVQETIWSFTKTISALRAGGYTGREALERATHESVATMPEFATIFREDADVRERLNAIGLTLPSQRGDETEGTGATGQIQADRPRVLGRVVDRIPPPKGSAGVPEAVSEALFQAVENAGPYKGSFHVDKETNDRVITAFELGDAGTMLHELGHFFWDTLTPAEQNHVANVLKFQKVGRGRNLGDRAGLERFTDAFTDYVRNSRTAPTEEMKSVFKKFKDWLNTILGEIKNLVDLSKTQRKNINKFFAEMMGKPPAGPAETKSRKESAAKGQATKAANVRQSVIDQILEGSETDEGRKFTEFGVTADEVGGVLDYALQEAKGIHGDSAEVVEWDALFSLGETGKRIIKQVELRDKDPSRRGVVGAEDMQLIDGIDEAADEWWGNLGRGVPMADGSHVQDMIDAILRGKPEVPRINSKDVIARAEELLQLTVDDLHKDRPDLRGLTEEGRKEVGDEIEARESLEDLDKWAENLRTPDGKTMYEDRGFDLGSWLDYIHSMLWQGREAVEPEHPGARMPTVFDEDVKKWVAEKLLRLGAARPVDLGFEDRIPDVDEDSWGSRSKNAEPGEPRYHEWKRTPHAARLEREGELFTEAPVSYASGHSGDAVKATAKENAGIGLLVTPKTNTYLDDAENFSHIILDNGVFTADFFKPEDEGGGVDAFDSDRFQELLDKASGHEMSDRILFVVAPDFIGDPKKTLARSTGTSEVKPGEGTRDWLLAIKEAGFRPAYAAQDGVEQDLDSIPWERFDVLFIGGTTAWKLGRNRIEGDPLIVTPREAREAGFNRKFLDMIIEAKRRGKKIHVGRVNSAERMSIVHGYGADTADGTFLRFAPTENLKPLQEWLEYQGRGVESPQEEERRIAQDPAEQGSPAGRRQDDQFPSLGEPSEEEDDDDDGGDEPFSLLRDIPAAKPAGEKFEDVKTEQKRLIIGADDLAGQQSLFTLGGAEEAPGVRILREAQKEREDREGGQAVMGFGPGGQAPRKKGKPAAGQPDEFGREDTIEGEVWETREEFVAEIFPGQEETQQRVLDNQGLKARRKWSDFWGHVRDTITYSRPQRHIPNVNEKESALRFAKFNNFFRRLKAVYTAAPEVARLQVGAIIDPLGKKQLMAFEMVLALRNMKRGVDSGQRALGAFGINTVEALDAALENAERTANASEPVMRALDRRERLRREVVQELVDLDLIGLEALDNDAYFHQMVQTFQDLASRFPITGGVQARAVKRGFQHRRLQGDELRTENMDWNLSFLESEYTWLTHAGIEARKAQLLRRLPNEMQPLKDLAKQRNDVALVGGQENFDKLTELRNELYFMRAEIAGGLAKPTSDERRYMAQLSDQIADLDPTMPERTQLARAFGEFGELPIIKAEMDINGTDIKTLVDRYKALKGSTGEAREAMELANVVMAAIGALTNRKRELLGDKYQTWETILQSERPDLAQFQPKPGNVFFKAWTVSDQLQEALHLGLIKEQKIGPEDLKAVKAVAPEREPMIFPVEVVAQLTATTRPPAHVILSTLEDMMRTWKAWTLMNPKRFLGYRLRNLSGDIDAVWSGAPGVFKYFGDAATDLHAYYFKSKIDMPDDVRDALEMGVIGGSEDTTDIQDVRSLGVFRRFSTDMKPDLKSVPTSLVKALIGVTRKSNSFAEEVLRLAAYRHYLSQLKSGKLAHYGGAKKHIVNAVRDTVGRKDAAAMLANKLLGDYGDLSTFGNWNRRYLMPFWAFQEINLARTPRLVINAWESGDLKRAVPSAAIRLVATSRIAHMLLATQLWNRAIAPWLMGDDDDRDQESDNPRYVRQNPHVNMGYNPDGTVRVFNNVGVLGDFLEWFGLNSASELLEQYRDGQISELEVLSQMLQDPLNKVVGSIRPDVKGVIEQISGRSSFPDALNWRRADRREMLAGIWGLEDEYKYLMGAIAKDGTRPRRDIRGYRYRQSMLGITTSLPGKNALGRIWDARERFLNNKGEDVYNPGTVTKMKPMREAALRDNLDAFQEAKQFFIANGGTYSQFREHIDRVGPEGRMKKEHRDEFEHEYLNDSERRHLKVAREYAHELRKRMALYWNQAKVDDPVSAEQHQQWLMRQASAISGNDDELAEKAMSKLEDEGIGVDEVRELVQAYGKQRDKSGRQRWKLPETKRRRLRTAIQRYNKKTPE